MRTSKGWAQKNPTEAQGAFLKENFWKVKQSIEVVLKDVDLRITGRKSCLESKTRRRSDVKGC